MHCISLHTCVNPRIDVAMVGIAVVVQYTPGLMGSRTMAMTTTSIDSPWMALKQTKTCDVTTGLKVDFLLKHSAQL